MLSLPHLKPQLKIAGCISVACGLFVTGWLLTERLLRSASGSTEDASVPSVGAGGSLDHHSAEKDFRSLLRLIETAERKSGFETLRRYQFAAVDHVTDGDLLTFIAEAPERRAGILRTLSYARSGSYRTKSFEIAILKFLEANSSLTELDSENIASQTYIGLDGGHSHFVKAVIDLDGCYIGMQRYMLRGENLVGEISGDDDDPIGHWVVPAQQLLLFGHCQEDDLAIAWQKMGSVNRKSLAPWLAMGHPRTILPLILSRPADERSALAIAAGKGIVNKRLWLEALMNHVPEEVSEDAIKATAKLWSYSHPSEVIEWAGQLEGELRSDIERTAAFFLAVDHPDDVGSLDGNLKSMTVELGILHGLADTSPVEALAYFDNLEHPEVIDLETRLAIVDGLVPTESQLAPSFFLKHISKQFGERYEATLQASEAPPSEVYGVLKTIAKIARISSDMNQGDPYRWVEQLHPRLKELGGVRYYIQDAIFRGKRDRVVEALRNSADAANFSTIAIDTLAIDQSYRPEIIEMLPENTSIEVIDDIANQIRGQLTYEPY